MQLQAAIRGHALCIFEVRLSRPGWHTVADRNDVDAHVTTYQQLTMPPLAVFVSLPHRYL